MNEREIKSLKHAFCWLGGGWRASADHVLEYNNGASLLEGGRGGEPCFTAKGNQLQVFILILSATCIHDRLLTPFLQEFVVKVDLVVAVVVVELEVTFLK